MVTIRRVLVAILFIPNPFAKSLLMLGHVKVDNVALEDILENVDIGVKEIVGEDLPVLFSIKRRRD